VDSPDGLLFTVTFNKSRLEGDAETRALVFAGENIANLRNPLPEGAGAGIFDLENRAWVTTVLDSFASKQKTLTLPGGYLVMNSLPGHRRTSTRRWPIRLTAFLSNEELLHQVSAHGIGVEHSRSQERDLRHTEYCGIPPMRQKQRRRMDGALSIPQGLKAVLVLRHLRHD
jgi:hypothetical protein